MILVTGAGGFIGKHVLAALSARETEIRCLVRKNTGPEKQNISYMIGDVLDYYSLLKATENVETVYYFIHMMGAQKEQERFDILDRAAITNTVKACKVNNVKRIIYLTGMCDPSEKLSRHLESRKEVEEIIKNSGINYTIFRASVIIGKGGASFEILDTAVRKLPVIPVFNWEKTRVQPIYIDDVVRYLVECLDIEETINKCYDVGSNEIFTYREMIREYAKILGLKRIFISIPGSWNRISSYILGKLAPVDPGVVYWLMESLKNNMLREPDDLDRIFGFEPLTFKESIEKIRELDK